MLDFLYHIKRCLNHIMPCLSQLSIQQAPFPSLTLIFLSDIRIALPRHATLFTFAPTRPGTKLLCLFCFVFFPLPNRRPKKASRVEPPLFFVPFLTREGRDTPGRSPVKTLHEPQKKKHPGFGRRFRDVSVTLLVIESYKYLACGFSVSHSCCK